MKTSRKTRTKGLLFLGVAIIYVLSPLDIIPDIIPVIGWLDDLLVGIGGIAGLIIAFRRASLSPVEKTKLADRS